MGSIYTCVAFTTERFIAVVRPIDLRARCTPSKTLCVILLVLLWSVTYNTPRFFQYKTEYMLVNTTSTCNTSSDYFTNKVIPEIVRDDGHNVLANTVEDSKMLNQDQSIVNKLTNSLMKSDTFSPFTAREFLRLTDATDIQKTSGFNISVGDSLSSTDFHEKLQRVNISNSNCSIGFTCVHISQLQKEPISSMCYYNNTMETTITTQKIVRETSFGQSNTYKVSI